MKAIRKTVLAVALAAGMGTASAAVTIDGDGYGFVGKGDVQLALNWNNDQLQSAVASGAIAFRECDPEGFGAEKSLVPGSLVIDSSNGGSPEVNGGNGWVALPITQ